MTTREIENIIAVFEATRCTVCRQAMERLLNHPLAPETREKILKALDEPILILK